MSANPSDNISKVRWYASDQSNPYNRIIWISISSILLLALLDLVGWIFDIAILKSVMPHWIPMKIITAICFVLAAFSLLIIRLNLPDRLRKVLLDIQVLIISIACIVTIYIYFYLRITGHESQIIRISILNFFFGPEARMALLTSFNFLFLGLVIYFLRRNEKKMTGLAHVFIIPVSVVSYLAVASYILGVYSSTEILNTPVALITGIEFVGICIAVLLMYPKTWLTKVFTSNEIGSIIAKRLLPGILILPLIIGWFRIKGEVNSVFKSEEGVVLVAITYAFCFFFLVWFTTRAVNLIDMKRSAVENELLQLNRILNAHSKSSQAIMHAGDEIMFLEDVCKIIIEDCGHAMVWIGFAQNDERKSVRPVASYGFEDGYIEQLNVTWDDSERGCGPTGIAIKTGKPSICRNMLTDPAFKPWREAALKRGYASSLVLPLKSEGKTFGAISIYSKKPDPFSNSEISLLTALANDSAYGISYVRLLESEKATARTLEESEKKFSTVFYSAPIAMSLACIPGGELYDVNQAWLDLIGIKNKEEIVGKTSLELGLIPDKKSRENILAQFNQKGFAKNVEMEASTRTGEKHYLLVNVHNVEIGGREYLLSTNEDITELKHAGKELNSTKNYLENLINYANAPIIVWAPDTSIQLFNKAFEHLTGYSSGEVTGKKLDMLFPRESRKDSNEKIKLALQERWETIEIPILSKNNDIKTILWNSANIYDSDNKSLISTIAQGHDITERKKAEEALIRSRQEWIETFDLIPDLIAIIDKDHRIVKANRSMLDKLNGSQQCITKQHCFECIHNDSKPHPLCPHSMMLKDGKEHISEIHEDRLGGDFLVSVTPIMDASGHIEGSVHVAHDITERKKMETALFESKEKLNLALDNGSIGVWEWDIANNVIEWDERMENIFGIEPGTFEGSYEAFEKFLVDEDLAHVKTSINKALESDVPFETVYRIISGTGDIKHISAKALLNRHPDGRPRKMTGVCFDITEMKKGAEQVLFKLNEDLLRSNKELEQFAYVASHDLQEPLRMISSFTQLLSKRYKDKLDNDANEFIQFAVDGAFRMQNLINDLLQFSRIQTRGKNLGETDMNIVLGTTINNLHHKILEKGALITNDELPVIYADSGQMVQLLQNLIGNSIKFCKTSPKIHVSAKAEKDHFVFSVKDNGIGIEPQYFDKIFSIFQRLHHKEEYEGTGIGLAICRRIVERHSGKISVESKPGKGTTFRFTIRNNQ
jgi:PAS domain S-box-containing protein